MGETRERAEHCLALKVMRLTKPTFGVSSFPVTPCLDLLNQDAMTRGPASDTEELEDLQLGKLLILPQAFGTIYLGETFSSYICVHNDSTENTRNINVKADLQTGTQRIGLVAGQNQTSLSPGETLDHVIHHEVKELGTHILVCDVTYSTQNSDKMNFRKFFKFQVMKPLDVKTKFYNAESDQVFLEAQVQNITMGSINLERVSLEPSSVYTVKPLNVDCDENENTGVLSSGNSLQSQDSWQYLFCLSPRADLMNDKALKSLTSIGKLDIVWRTAYCDRGRLQTSQLQRSPPVNRELALTVISAPAMALRRKPVSICIRITNNSDRTLELDQCLETDPKGKVYWVGKTNVNLGLLEPGGSLKIWVEAVLQETGLHFLSGVKLQDSLLSRVYEFPDLLQIFVVEEEDLLHFLEDNYTS